jgi:hypothetical protein
VSWGLAKLGREVANWREVEWAPTKATSSCGEMDLSWNSEIRVSALEDTEGSRFLGEALVASYATLVWAT